MLAKQQLSPKEKRRFEKRIHNIQVLSKGKILSDINRVIKREQLRMVLVMLGIEQPSIFIQADALDIINDWKPFKVRRLRTLVNGRRPRQ